MRALAEAVHARGLKLGIYSSPGPKTCEGFEGSWQHEAKDAATYASWGIDFLKYDWCSYEEITPVHTLAELQKPYLVMRDALRAVDRDIVYSLCQYGYGDVWQWGADVGGNLWRSSGDLLDNWSNLESVGFRQAGREIWTRPGHWNDTDMLVVGNVGWGPNLHPTKLTPNEQMLHLALWALQAAPVVHRRGPLHARRVHARAAHQRRSRRRGSGSTRARRIANLEAGSARNIGRGRFRTAPRR